MAILWCGGEDIDFPNPQIVHYRTDSGWFRSGYARGGLSVASAYRNVSTYSSAFPGGAVTSAWVTARIWAPYASANYRKFGVGRSGSGTYNCLLMAGVGSNGRVAIYKYDNATWTQLAESATVYWGAGALHKWDMQIVSYGATATVRIYKNSDLAVEYTGNVLVGSMTDFDSVVMNMQSDDYSNGDACSEFIVADEDTRAMGLVTLAPNAAGDASAWAGAYTDIDELVKDDADVVYSNVNDNEMQVNLSNLPAGTFSVKAVQISARCQKDPNATPTKIALGVKTGGSINAGSDIALDASWATKQRLMTTNPVTTNAWTQAELDALQINLKARA